MERAPYIRPETGRADNRKALERMRIETIESGSLAMDYFKFGRGGEALVILPGLSVQSVMDSADAIAKAYRLLADNFTVYVLDRRRNLPAAYPLSDLAHDTADALRALDLGCVHLLGASLGGMVAMSIAIGQPDLVRKLILCSTSARVEETQYRTIEEWARLAKAKDAEGLYLMFGKALYPQDTFEQLRGLLTESAKSVTDEDLERFIVLAEGMKGFDVTDSLEKIACPVLAIGSKDDKILGVGETLRIAERLGGRADFELHLYDGYGHAAYDTAPDFKERVLRFLLSR